MTLLITGGGGYIGTVLIRQLLAHTLHDIIVLDRFAWGVQPLASLITPQTSRRVQIINGNITSAPAVKMAMRHVDAVIHLAAIVGFPACDASPIDADLTNVFGTQHLCLYLDGRPLLFASTGSVYGKVTEVCTEASPLAPLTHYGRTKLAAEKMVIDAGGMAFRIATLYGLSPRMRWDILVHDFARLGVAGEISLFDGGARRTFLHIEDAGWAFRWGLEQHRPGVWNLGSEVNNRTKYEIARMVSGLTGCRLSEMAGHDPDERDYQVSYRKIRQAGWSAKWAVGEETLRPVVEVARVWREG